MARTVSFTTRDGKAVSFQAMGKKSMTNLWTGPRVAKAQTSGGTKRKRGKVAGFHGKGEPPCLINPATGKPLKKGSKKYNALMISKIAKKEGGRPAPEVREMLAKKKTKRKKAHVSAADRAVLSKDEIRLRQQRTPAEERRRKAFLKRSSR